MSEQEKRNEFDTFIEDIKTNQIMNPESGFRDRLDEFKEHVNDFIHEPLKYTIMCDAYMAFFDVSEEWEEMYLKGSISVKKDLINKLDTLIEPQEMLERVLYLTNLLFYTNMTMNDKFYMYVGNKLFYILSGEGAFLTDIGMSLYNVPPQPKQQKMEIPKRHVEGMYQ